MKEMLMNEHVKSTDTVDRPLRQVWDKLVAFGGTEKFVPDLIEKVVLKGSGIGAVRTIYLNGGGEIIEKLTGVDESNHRLTFVILSTPMPLTNYEGSFTVRPLAESSCAVDFESLYLVRAEKKDEMKL